MSPRVKLVRFLAYFVLYIQRVPPVMTLRYYGEFPMSLAGGGLNT